MQIISSLLNLQKNRVYDEAAAHLLEDSQKRVLSMALVHEKLYQSDAFSRIDFVSYLRDLVVHIQDPLLHGRIKVEIAENSESLNLDRAIPCGLVVNELLTNAFKHAFPEGRNGKIRISFRREENFYELSVADDGVGLPEGVDKGTTLGLQLVFSLSGQLGGHLYIDRSQGTQVILRFPV